MWKWILSGGWTNWRSEFVHLGTFSFIPHVEEGMGDKKGLGVPGQCELLIFAWQQKSINTKFKKIYVHLGNFTFSKKVIFFLCPFEWGFFWVVGCFFLQVYTKKTTHKDLDGGWVLTLYKDPGINSHIFFKFSGNNMDTDGGKVILDLTWRN